MRKTIQLVVVLLVISIQSFAVCSLWRVDRGENKNLAACATYPIYSITRSFDIAFASSSPQVYNFVQLTGSSSCSWLSSPYTIEDSGYSVADCELFWSAKLYTYDANGDAHQVDSEYLEGCPEYTSKRCLLGSGDSPILIPLTPSGLSNALTSAADGVSFNLARSRFGPRQYAWTKSNADAGWLVIDNDEDGNIKDGSYLFGNVSPQDAQLTEDEPANGFRALRAHDRNRDGLITPPDRLSQTGDGIWNRLAVWTDTNHNGLSEAGELHSLTSLGIKALSVVYKEDRRKDQYGNEFRFRAPVYLTDNSVRQAYDVFLQQQ